MQSEWKYKAIHLSWEIRRRHNTGKVRTWDALLQKSIRLF